MKHDISDVITYSALAGMGLVLLFGGLIPLLRSKTGSVVIQEKNRAVLIAETAGVAGLTVFGVVKLAQALKEKPDTEKK